jgi:hypothetical protein
MAQMTHSRLGASSCKRWLNCPGSVSLLETLPSRDTSSYYAAEGTVAHEICEKYLNLGLPSVSIEMNGQLGETQEVDGHEVKITEQMIEGATLYASTILGEMVSYGLFLPKECWSQSTKATKNVKKLGHLFIEKQFTISSIDAELSGTNDACVYVPNNRLIVYDFKYGAGVPVEVERNEQLMFYALGAIEMLGGLEQLKIKTVELVVVQPRCPHSDGPIRRWEASIGEMKAFAEELREGVERVKEDYPAFSSGSHCRWCDAKVICPSYKQKVNEGAQMEFAPVVGGTEPKVLEPPKAYDLTVEQIANVMKLTPTVEGFIKDVQSRATELLNQGVEVPGFKLVQKRANREWIDEQTVIDNFGAIAVVEKVITPAQLEKKVGKDKILDYTMTPDAGTTIVSSEDKRQGVVPVQQAFDCIGFEMDI